MKTNIILQGDCIEEIRKLPDNSIDAVITDPPYGLGFMNKEWDSPKKHRELVEREKKRSEQRKKEGKSPTNAPFSQSVQPGLAIKGKKEGKWFQEWCKQWSDECLRVLKPGGYLLSFCATRTYHRMTCAIEDAGFEIRDMLEWIYASGFPKSHNIGKAYDKKMGNEREEYIDEDFLKRNPDTGQEEKGIINKGHKDGLKGAKRTKGNSKWEGFGTGLKPAHEPIVLARKPLSEKTIVENVIKHGTGALDISGTRIPINKNDEVIAKNPHTASKGTDEYTQNCYGKYNPTEPTNYKEVAENSGRFPANLLVTDDALNDGIITKSTGRTATKGGTGGVGKVTNFQRGSETSNINDSGSKSRYFDIDVWGEKHGLIQTPKASKKERNAGCEGLEEKNSASVEFRPNHMEKSLKGESGNPYGRWKKLTNNHPTVKPIHLMSWLVRLVSKEGDIVLDPFMGSGTTAIACQKLNRKWIGIEKEEEYIKISKARIKPFIEQERLK